MPTNLGVLNNPFASDSGKRAFIKVLALTGRRRLKSICLGYISHLGILAILIASGTISFLAVKAALANPVKSLRSN